MVISFHSSSGKRGGKRREREREGGEGEFGGGFWGVGEGVGEEDVRRGVWNKMIHVSCFWLCGDEGRKREKRKKEMKKKKKKENFDPKTILKRFAVKKEFLCFFFSFFLCSFLSFFLCFIIVRVFVFVLCFPKSKNGHF